MLQTISSPYYCLKITKGIYIPLYRCIKWTYISLTKLTTDRGLTKCVSNTASPIGLPVLFLSWDQQNCITKWTAGAAPLMGPVTLPHQVEHFLVGFIGEAMGQLYASANDGEFIMIPLTLKRRI
jgi:hypothetical protein